MNAKIYIACSGLGYIRRGLETFSEDLFHALSAERIGEVCLLKGSGENSSREIVMPHLKRTSRAAKFFGKITAKNPFYIQNISFALAAAVYLSNKKDFVVYTGEPVVYAFLNSWRRWMRRRFKIIFFTGGQTIPKNFSQGDILHHVTTELVHKASQQNIKSDLQFVIPHFIRTGLNSYLLLPEEKRKLRQELKLPENSCVILSVGAIDNSVKRMNYLIEEVSRLDGQKYFLLMLGEVEQETESVRSFAAKKLTEKNYLIATVSKSELEKYYPASDIFVLASLKEGFGLVYLEALTHGLPVIAHCYAVTQQILGKNGHLLDLTQEHSITDFMERFDLIRDHDKQLSRRVYVESNFSWSTLKEHYLEMFSKALNGL